MPGLATAAGGPPGTQTRKGSRVTPRPPPARPTLVCARSWVLVASTKITCYTPCRVWLMAVEFKDYYRNLGVDRSADDKAIKSAYRKLARKFHPDVAKGKDAGDRFREINEA